MRSSVFLLMCRHGAELLAAVLIVVISPDLAPGSWRCGCRLCGPPLTSWELLRAITPQQLQGAAIRSEVMVYIKMPTRGEIVPVGGFLGVHSQ